MRLSIMLKRPVNIEDFPEYRDRVLEKIRR
jgi:hypothetical protein